MTSTKIVEANVAQHFLLSAAARSLSLNAVIRMSDEEAFEALKLVRWVDNGGARFRESNQWLRG